MKTFHFPDSAAFDFLRSEASFYLQPAGFVPGSDSGSGWHIEIVAGEKKSDESYTLEPKSRKNGTRLEIRSEGVCGATHGFYHCLRLLGWEFSFFADATPKRLKLDWPGRGKFLSVRPAFPVRGLLPWHNFLNSPSTWNFADYQRFLLTLRRLGGNTVLFRQRDHGKGEPLAAMPDGKGGWILGERTFTLVDAPWGGTPGMRASDFAHGTGKYFPDAKKGDWGAAHCFEKDPILAAQSEFAEVCKFSKSIGIDLAFGFELGGDPSVPGAKEQVRCRLRHLLETYPHLAALNIWQYEGNGLRGWTNASASPGYPALKKKYGRHFEYLGNNPARQAEGARLAEWFRFVYQTAREIRPSLRIVFAGWGGDRWMRWSDYWQGLHEQLPEDAVLCQLDNIDPYKQEGVHRPAKSLASQRELWAIPWIESDSSVLGRASQWHPQEDAGLMMKLARSAEKNGYRGLIGLHWQTAAVEQNISSLVGAGWKRWRSSEEFHIHYASRFFSGKHSPAVAKILSELEELGPGWSGTGQQVECAPFSWDPLPALTTAPLTASLKALWQELDAARKDLVDLPKNPEVWICFDALLFACDQTRGRQDAIARLEELRDRLRKLKIDSPHARRLEATMDFVLSYEELRRALMKTGWLANQQELIKETVALNLRPDPRLMKSFKRGVAELESVWGKMFDAQVRRLHTRGDLGNLVNLNIKAYAHWKSFRDAVGG